MNRVWKKVMTAGVGVSVMVLTAACGSSTTSGATGSSGATASKSPYKVLAVVDTSGPLNIYGTKELLAARAAAAYWNARGGIDGRKLVVSYVNGNSDPTTASTALVQWVAANGKPNLVIDAESGTDDTGIPPIVKRDNLLTLGLDSAGVCASNSSSTCPTRFSPAPTNALAMDQTAAWMKSQGYKSVGLLAEEDAFTQSEEAPLQAALKKEGISTTVATFPTNAVSVTPQMSELAAAHVNVIWGAALGPAAGYILSARSSLGLSTPIEFDPGASAQDLTTLVSSASLKNTYELIARPVSSTSNDPGRNAMFKAATTIGSVNSPLAMSIIWDSFVVLHDAAKQAGTTNQASVINALLHLSPANQTDPLLAYAPKVTFSSSVHQNVGAPLDTYLVVPVGPLNGQGEVVPAG